MLNLIANTNNSKLLAQINDKIKNATEEELKIFLFQAHNEEIKRSVNKIIEKKFSIIPEDLSSLIVNSITSVSKTVDIEIVKDFLNKCENGGIFDASIFVSQNKDGMYHFPLKDTAYRPLIEALLNINITNGNATIGRGEIGIAFMCNNAFKASSDISINFKGQTIPVEIKSTKNKRDFMMSVSTGENTCIESVSLLIETINSVGGNYSKTNKVSDNGISQLNNKTILELNYYFQKLGQERTQTLLLEVLAKIYNQIPNFVDNYKSEIVKSVNSDGSINYDVLKIATSEINFDYYQNLSGHHGVLMLNISNLTFTYQTSGKEFSKLIAANRITAVSAMDFRTLSNGGVSFIMKC